MSGALTENQKLRLKIVRLHNENRNEYNIARKLHVCPKFVHYTICRLNDIGSIKDRPRSGRPRKLTILDKKRLVKEVKGHRRSTRKISATFKTSKSEKISHVTVRSILKEQKLIPHRGKKTTLDSRAKREESDIREKISP